MATKAGVVADESWRDRPDGLVTLTGDEVRRVRALLAVHGWRYTVAALNVTTKQLDAVTVNGAPASLVSHVRAMLGVVG